MSNILVANNAYHGTSSACVVDLTPPIFSGINFIDVETRGQIRAAWSAATDATAPIRYEVYIQVSTATGLFNTNNIIAITPNLQYDTFQMPDGSFLVNGSTYFIGVRAIDGVSNRDSNVVSMSVISTGVSVSADEYRVEGIFAIAENNMFEGTMWGLKNSVIDSGTVFGTASYQVYDKDGVAVVGMSESGIAVDANNQFKITPVSNLMVEHFSHYVVEISIVMDSEIRNGYSGILRHEADYSIAGAYAIDEVGDFRATFWVETDHNVQLSDLSRLGNASYDVLDKDGNVVPFFTESGISPNANGVYIPTPVPGVNPADVLLFVGRVTVEIDGANRTTLIPIQSPQYAMEVKGQFSINALNQLQATFWITNGDHVFTGATLGAANYTVYDASGIAVAGLTQSGIVSDANGRFNITPTSAALLTDLTHYSVKIGIVAGGTEKIAYKGFTLLGN